jgi:hypothetical protein
VRGVLLERHGVARLFERVDAQVVDEDTDAGGSRRLFAIPVANGEPIVALLVHCPSTSRPYHLRVPPQMRTCRQAAAWLAGFWNPDDYNPIIET